MASRLHGLHTFPGGLVEALGEEVDLGGPQDGETGLGLAHQPCTASPAGMTTVLPSPSATSSTGSMLSSSSFGPRPQNTKAPGCRLGCIEPSSWPRRSATVTPVGR